jgi:hypothetical protein
MALQGNLRDFSATEILQLVGSQKKTGCLTMTWNTERAVIYVHEGRIVATRNPGMANDDPLLAFLRRIHRLSDEQLRGIQTIQRESSRDLEDLLLNGRYLEADELASLIERQILDDLMRLVRWENGTYRFDPHVRWPHPPNATLSVEGVMIEAARRVDEQKRFVSLFKDPYQLLGVRDLPDPNEPLTEEERELFGIIDGQHTVQDVVEGASMSEYETYEALHRMLEANWIEFVGRREPGEQAVAATVAATAAAAAAVRHPRRTWWREAVMAVFLLGMLFGLRQVSRAADPARRPVPQGDVFAAAAVRDLRFALDLYHRERGTYPHHVDDLIEGRWIGADRAHVPGYVVFYQVERDAQSYRLELQPLR